MKKYKLFEQVGNVVKVEAPKDELQKLLDIGKLVPNATRIQNLEVDERGNPKVVTVGGKKYIAGILTSKGNFVVYDGRVLKKENGKYTFFTQKDPKTNRESIAIIKGVPDTNLNGIFENKLKQFNLTNVVDLYSVLDDLLNNLQSLINQGAVSYVFKDFNNLLIYFYPNDDTKRLKSKDGQTNFFPTVDTEELMANFRTLDLKRYGIPGQYYLPRTSGGDLVSAQTSVDTTKCGDILKNYLIWASTSMSTGSNSLSPNQISEYKRSIKVCQGLGAYRDWSLKKTDMSGYSIDRQFDPFRGFLGLGEKSLSFKEIKKYLNDLGKQKGFESGGWALLENKINKNDILFEVNIGDLDLNNDIPKENGLSKIIKTKLQEELYKKKKLISEEIIIKDRLLKVFESKENIKNFTKLPKKERERLSLKFLHEIQILNNENLLNENFLDFVKGIFGNIFPGAIDALIEPVIDSLLTGLGLGGYWKQFFVSFITTNPTKMIKAFKSCDDMTDLVASALAEGMIMTLQEKTGTDGTSGTLIRNILGKAFKEQPFIAGLSKSLREPVCELWSGLTDKAKNVYNKLSDKTTDTAITLPKTV